MNTGTLIATVGIWAGASLTLQAAVTLDISGAPAVPQPANSGLLSYLQNHFLGIGPLVYKYEVRLGEVEPLRASRASGHTAVDAPPSPYETLRMTYSGGSVADPNYMLVKNGPAGAHLWNVGTCGDGAETLVIVNGWFTGGNGNGIHGISNIQIFGVNVPEATTLFGCAGALSLLLFGAAIHPRRSTVLRIGR